MTGQTYTLPEAVAPLLGDPHPLVEQIGAGSGTAAPVLAPSSWQRRGVQSRLGLRHFLESYRAELLVPVELPVILRAYGHASRNEVRELIALDREIAAAPGVREFAAASCRVGQRQLNRLRPLRDHRLLRRYRAAIERGEAHGWHTVVYGVSLAVFSLPLRQGLVGYAARTLGGFIENAAGPLALTVGDSRELQAQACAPVPEFVQHLLAAEGIASLHLERLG
jgi:urease accessory protein UreF